MQSRVDALARRLWPEWGNLTARDQRRLRAELIMVLESAPLALVTTLWVVYAASLDALRAQWLFLAVVVIVTILAGRISYFQILGGEAGHYSLNSSDMVNVIIISAVLVVGPPAIVAHIVGRVVYFLINRPEQAASVLQANWLRSVFFNVWTANVSLMVALFVYYQLGGVTPLRELAIGSVLPAVVLVVVEFMVTGLLLWHLIWLQSRLLGGDSVIRGTSRRRRIMQFFLISALPAVFGILGAVLYTRLDWPGYLFFLAAVLLTSLLARRQSQAAVLSQLRARHLGLLEELGRAFIKLSPDLGQLPQLLREFLPRMFDYDDVEIRFIDDSVLLCVPEQGGSRDPRLWDWVYHASEPAAFLKGDCLPWIEAQAGENLLLAPIRHTESDEPLGAICLRARGRLTTIGLRESLPSLQVLAAQVASLLYRREAYEKRLALERVTRELTMAREMQVTFLPHTLPQAPGWELRAHLEPARQASGDFYDVVQLDEDRLALLVADVADKGMSAALFMALSRTLLRTYAVDYPMNPERTIAAANRRIRSDTTDDSFVTVFYGVLHLESGLLRYVNAGHNPPFVVCRGSSQMLQSTGLPLGILPDSEWQVAETRMGHGDLLLLYSDGITEAHNGDDELFGEQRLLDVVAEHCSYALPQVERAVLDAVSGFAGARPQYDDLTLLMARRLGS